MENGFEDARDANHVRYIASQSHELNSHNRYKLFPPSLIADPVFKSYHGIRFLSDRRLCRMSRSEF